MPGFARRHVGPFAAMIACHCFGDATLRRYLRSPLASWACLLYGFASLTLHPVRVRLRIRRRLILPDVDHRPFAFGACPAGRLRPQVAARVTDKDAQDASRLARLMCS